MDNQELEEYFQRHRKGLAVLFVAVGVLAVSGYFMGIRQTEHLTNPAQHLEVRGHEAGHVTPAAAVPTAPKYSEAALAPWHVNRDWKFSLANLPHYQPGADESTPPDSERVAAIERRKALRAYDGAPPVIPHAIDTLHATACASCHNPNGNLLIDGKRPAEIAHPWMSNCTSCHVPADGLRQLTAPSESRLVVENSFQGKASAGRGSRAYVGAPPTTPHPVWMHQNCLACHGPGREHAIRTPHPQRRNCLQCHAPNAAFDNREAYLTTPQPPDHAPAVSR